MFKLNNMKSNFGSNHNPKRKGRGMGSGNGKTGGRGHKGQKARSGGGVPAAFEGGQVPLQRRLPKIGFRSASKPYKIEVSLAELENFAGRDVQSKELLPKSIRNATRSKVSITGTRLPASLPKSVEAHKFLPATKKVLEAAGVTLKVVGTAKDSN